MSEVIQIAKCPEHGVHGERDECFVCGGEVEHVDMVPMTFRGLLAILDAYYPADIFVGDSAPDVGVRLVVLARKLVERETAIRELADALRWALYWIGLKGVVPIPINAEVDDEWEHDQWEKWAEARKVLKRHHIDVDPSPATRKERL